MCTTSSSNSWFAPAVRSLLRLHGARRREPVVCVGRERGAAASVVTMADGAGGSTAGVVARLVEHGEKPSWLRRLMVGLVLFPRQVLIALVRGYRLLLSPSLGSSCRFMPSCSAYALDALGRHGAVAGSGLTMWRIARCHPWCAGGHDPVPVDKPALFTGLLTARRFSLPSRKKSP